MRRDFMKKQKTLKILSTSTIAATAFVSTSAADAAPAAGKIEQLVTAAKQAGTVLKWAISIEGSADGTTRPWAAYNAAKNAYKQAVAAVNTLPAAQRYRYLADLDENVLLHITRTMHYIDAITAGEKIKVKQQTLSNQLNRNLINDDTEKAYHELSREIRKQAILLDRVYGKSTRDLIRAQYKKAAEKVRDSAIYAVTVKIELDLAIKALQANNTAESDKHLAEARKYLKYVDNPVIKKILTDRLNAIDIPYIIKISAAEPKRIKIQFNRAMLAGYSYNAAENPANYTVSGRSIKNVQLSTDKKTATIELYDPLYTNSSYSVTVKRNIQTANYESIGNSDFISSFIFSDTTKPTVTSITSLLNGNVEIRFSELIDRYSPIGLTIDGKSVKSVSLTNDSDTIVIPKSELDRLNLRKGRYYSIVVSGARDLVVNTPNTMNVYRSTFLYNPASDTVAPEVRTVSVKDERTIRIEFSEPLASFTGSSNLAITKGNSTIKPTTVKDVSDGKRTAFEVELPASVYGTNETAVRLNIQVKAFKDVEGNTGKTTDRTVTLSKDLTPPRFVSAIFDLNANEIQLTFSKTLKAGQPAPGKITMYDQDNKSITPALKSNRDNKIIIDARNVKDGVYLINVSEGAVKDQSISQNNNAAFSVSVTKKSDSIKPEVTFVESGNNGQFTAVFSEPVTVESATSSANYFIEGNQISGNSQFSVSNDKKVVTVSLPEGTIQTTKKYTITARGIKDLSDNTMNTYSATLTLKDNTQPLLTGASRSGNNIKLTFSENIVLPDNSQGNFMIKVNGNEVKQFSVENGGNDRELLIVPKDANLFSRKNITIQTTTSTTIRDMDGNLLKAGLTQEIH